MSVSILCMINFMSLWGSYWSFFNKRLAVKAGDACQNPHSWPIRTTLSSQQEKYYAFDHEV